MLVILKQFEDYSPEWNKGWLLLEKCKLFCVVAFKLGHWVWMSFRLETYPTLLILRHSEMDWNPHPWIPWLSSLLTARFLSASISCEKIPDNKSINQSTTVLLILLLQRTLNTSCWSVCCATFKLHRSPATWIQVDWGKVFLPRVLIMRMGYFRTSTHSEGAVMETCNEARESQLSYQSDSGSLPHVQLNEGDKKFLFKKWKHS